MRITCRHEFNCPPAELWPYLEEPGKIRLWMKGVEENVATSDGPTRPGSTFRMSIREGRRLVIYEGEITAYNPNRLLGLRLRGGCLRPDSIMHVEYRLTDLGERTQLDYVCEVDVRGAYRVFAFLFGWTAKLQIRSFFRRLGRLVEPPAAATRYT